MSTIQQFLKNEYGFFPVMSDNDWQIAILNYLDTQDIANINRIEVHNNTDEAFILLSGRAVLITATVDNTTVQNWYAVQMQAKIVYNIPKTVWHNVMMERDSTIIIVEKNNTHIEDVRYHYLTEDEKNICQNIIAKKLS